MTKYFIWENVSSVVVPNKQYGEWKHESPRGCQCGCEERSHRVVKVVAIQHQEGVFWARKAREGDIICAQGWVLMAKRERSHLMGMPVTSFVRTWNYLFHKWSAVDGIAARIHVDQQRHVSLNGRQLRLRFCFVLVPTNLAILNFNLRSSKLNFQLIC